MQGTTYKHPGWVLVCTRLPVGWLLVALWTMGLGAGSTPCAAGPLSEHARGSAVTLIEAGRPASGQAPDLYASWNRVSWEQVWDRHVPPRVPPATPPSSREEVDVSSSQTVVYLAGVAGMALVIALVYAVFSRKGVQQPGDAGKRGSGPGGRNTGREPEQGSMSASRRTEGAPGSGTGSYRPRAPALRLDGPTPSPEEMRRHLGELLGKVQGAKPLAKRNSDEF